MMALTLLFCWLAWRSIEGGRGHGDWSRIPYTRLAMLAIAVLFLGTGLEHMEGIARQGKTIEEYATLVAQGLADPIRSCGMRGCSSYATWAGLALVWFAAALTAITGWDYFRKSLPQLKD
jgi:CDP-diacylglycerol--glycerol-3-phosphate 3-phosphatidyltransferase